MSYFRPEIDALDAYTPGEQPPSDGGVIKLNTNENPYPPSPRALAALDAIQADHLRLYPQPYANEFRTSVADVLGIDPESILVGNGSDDILTMLIRSITGPSRPVAYPSPTYILYGTLAQMQGAPIVEIPFDEDYGLPVDELGAANAALTLVASPNSPSGTRPSNDLLAALASRLDGILALDEAYVEFAEANALELVSRFENVAILRTLSKSHALAGLRLGYAIGVPRLIAGLAKVKDSYNVGAVAARVGAAAVQDREYTAELVGRVRRSRSQLAAALAALGFRVWPSEANFLLVRPPDGRAHHIYEGLKQRGILVRYFNRPALEDKLRITVGTDEQNDRLVVAVTELLA